jgi:thymidylate kinase
MIIEFFGPPAAGKSTLSYALASQLRAEGSQIIMSTSARPAEKTGLNKLNGLQSPIGQSVGSAPLQRVGKLAQVVQSVFADRSTDYVGTNLLKILPPQNWLSLLRLQRYLCVLKQSLEKGRGHHGITIIDQGYLAALSSLAARVPTLNGHKLARGFALLPRPDLVICLDAPDYVLQARIAARHARQTAIERLFEQDTRQTRKQVEMVRIVAAMLKANNWPALYFNSDDEYIIERIIEKIAQKNASNCEAA